MNVFWNETAFPLCSATDSCWNRKVDSLTSPVMLVARLPISRTSSTVWWCQVPPCFDGHKKEHVGVKQLVVLRVLVGCCVGGCWSCLSGWVCHMLLLLLLLLLTSWNSVQQYLYDTLCCFIYLCLFTSMFMPMWKLNFFIKQLLWRVTIVTYNAGNRNKMVIFCVWRHEWFILYI